MLIGQSLWGQCNLSGANYQSGTAPTVSCTSVSATTCAYFSEFTTFTGLVVGQQYEITSSFTPTANGPFSLNVYTSSTVGTAPLSFASSATSPIVSTFTATTTTVYAQNSEAACARPATTCNAFSIKCLSCAPPPAPVCNTLSAPANAATAVSTAPVLSWTAATGADSYDIYIGTSAASATLLGNIVGTSAQLNPAAGLQAFTTYFWYVIPKNICAGTTASGCSSGAFSFTTGAAPPVNDDPTGAIALTVGATCSPIAATNLNATTTPPSGYTNPAGCSAATSPTDVWFSFVAPASGNVQIALSGVTTGALGQVVIFSAASSAGPFTVVSSSCNSTATAGNFAPPLNTVGLVGAQTYYARVAGNGSANPTGGFSICVKELTAPNCPVGYTIPANAATGVSALPTLSWAANSDATSYDVYYGTSTNPTGAGASATPINVLTTSYTIPTASALTNGTTYYWRAVPKNSLGVPTGCPEWTFTVVPLPSTFSGTGNWSDATKWNNGVPSCGADAIIAAAANCTVDVAAAALNVTINGTLLLNGNNLTVGSCTSANGGNSLLTFASTGVLNISSGTLDVRGRFLMVASSKLLQSGGLIRVDPNDGTAAGSVASGNICTIVNSGTAAAPGTVLSGGTIMIVDPPFAISGNSLHFTTVSGVGLIPSGTHKVVFGDGVSTTPGGYPFEVATLGTSSRLAFNDLEINAGIGTNRHVSTVNTIGQMPVLRDLTITSGELRIGGVLHVARNFVNNGIFTSTGSALAMQSFSPNTSALAVSILPASISGSGVFRNAVPPAAITANLPAFTVNNSNAAGVTVASNLQVAGTFTQTLGIVNMGANLLTIGVSAATTTTAGTWSYTAGRVVGKVKKWFTSAIGTGAWTFPVGTLALNRNTSVTFSATPITTGGTLTVNFAPGLPSGTNLTPANPQTINGQAINGVSPTGTWQIEAGDGLDFTGKTYTAAFDASGFTKQDGATAITTLTDIRLIKRSAAATDWTDASATSTTAAPSALGTISIAAQSSFSIFAVAGVNAVLPITLKSFTATENGAVNAINWETAVESNVRNFVIEKSSDAKNWSKLGEETPKASKTYRMTDNTPFVTTYYRLKNVDNDGRTDLSNTIVVNRKTGKFTITSLAPNPTTSDMNLKFETTENTNVVLNVMDIFGRVVLSQNTDAIKGFNAMTINTSEIPAGAYFLNINDGVNTLTQRIIKN